MIFLYISASLWGCLDCEFTITKKTTFHVTSQTFCHQDYPNISTDLKSECCKCFLLGYFCWPILPDPVKEFTQPAVPDYLEQCERYNMCNTCNLSLLGPDVVMIITLRKTLTLDFVAVSAFCWGSYADPCILKYQHWYHMKITLNGDTDDFCGHKCFSLGLSCLWIHQKINQATTENLHSDTFHLTS